MSTLFVFLFKAQFILILSTASAGLLLGALKFKAKNWAFLLLALLPLVFIYWWTPNNRIVSYHSFWHTSIVYQILNGNIPPNNPLLGGEILLYPWATHLLVAAMSYILRVSPPTAFALVNLCALLLSAILVFKISRFFSSDRTANVFAVFLSIFGITFTRKNLISLIASPAPRNGILVFEKFGNVNSTHLGVLFFALFLYSLLHIFSENPHDKRYYATLVISVVGAGFFYPFHWLGVLVCCFSCCLILFLLHKRNILSKIVAVFACALGGTLLVLPYIYLISLGKSEELSLTLASSLHVLKSGFTYLLTVLPISIIIFWKRKILLNSLRTKTNSTLILITAITTTALMYIFISGPLGVEYKYAMLSYFSLGILGSVCLRDIYYSNRVICFLLIASFLLPFSSYMFSKVEARTLDYTYIVEDGIYLRHRNPGEDELYRWISTQTNRNAIFVDSNLPTVALFGRRQVYYGQPYEHNWSSRTHLGWYQPFKFLGYSLEMTEARKKVVDEIYLKSNAEISEDVFSELNNINSTRDMYIIARDAVANKKLVNDERFNKIFENNSTTVYKLFLSSMK